MPHTIDKLLNMTQKLTEDVKIMKIEHEARIANLEKSMDEIKGNLKALVEIRKEAMNNNV